MLGRKNPEVYSARSPSSRHDCTAAAPAALSCTYLKVHERLRSRLFGYATALHQEVREIEHPVVTHTATFRGDRAAHGLVEEVEEVLFLAQRWVAHHVLHLPTMAR